MSSSHHFSRREIPKKLVTIDQSLSPPSFLVTIDQSLSSQFSGNYRPISLLPVFSKVIEKIVANQLVQYTEHNSLLSSTQHSFNRNYPLKQHSCKSLKKIYGAIDNREIFLLTLCDFSMAFDSVSHDILLKKMH